MKISTKLKIAVFVPLLMALLIGLALVFSYLEMEKARENGDIVRRIRTNITELNHVVYSYMLYHEERPRRQFQAEYDSLMRLIGSATFRSPDQKRLLANIRANSETMEKSFLRLVMHYDRLEKQGKDELFDDVEERLVGQLLVRSYAIDADASLLRSLVDDELRKTHVRTIVFVFFAMAVMLIPITVILFRTKKNIGRSLSQLRTGTEMIGAGRLGHRIAMQGGDELGDLARSFDEMTATLQNVTVSRDELQQQIEERKRIEEELKVNAARLEEANRELESFSYSISHDLRAPLRAIDGFTKMLLRTADGKLDDEERRRFSVIRDNARKMGQLIDDLLTFSRLGRNGISLAELNMEVLFREAWKEQRDLAPARNIEFRMDELPRAVGDKSLIRQILANLLSNAVKFTGSTEHPLIEVGGRSGDSESLYYVRDNGAGFDMKYSDKLFLVFHRLHPESEYEGTGIGLAIVSRIVQRHGGRVWAEAKPGQGATFYFTLPPASPR